MTRYEFYVGLNHKDNPYKRISKEVIKKALKDFFESKEIAFSIDSHKGGYVHEDGTYVLEDSIRITVIGEYSENQLLRFANEIKRIYEQESILLLCTEIDSRYVKDGN